VQDTALIVIVKPRDSGCHWLWWLIWIFVLTFHISLRSTQLYLELCSHSYHHDRKLQ